MCETAFPNSSVLSCRLFWERILKNVLEGFRRGWSIILWSFSLVSYLCQVQALFPPWPGGGEQDPQLFDPVWSLRSVEEEASIFVSRKHLCTHWLRRKRSNLRCLSNDELVYTGGGRKRAPASPPPPRSSPSSVITSCEKMEREESQSTLPPPPLLFLPLLSFALHRWLPSCSV